MNINGWIDRIQIEMEIEIDRWIETYLFDSVFIIAVLEQQIAVSQTVSLIQVSESTQANKKKKKKPVNTCMRVLSLSQVWKWIKCIDRYR